MSGAHFTINQAANSVPSGTQDVARVDIYAGQVVHLVGDSSAGQGSPAWTILSWPDGASRTQPTNPHTFDATYTFTPGSYRLEFLVDDGTGANAKTFIIRVTRNSGGLVIDDGVAEPAFGEEVGDDNATSNDRGYAKVFEVGLARQMPAIDSVATLLTRVANRHKHVRLLGYSTSGDGGGGHVYWDASSTATHDGGRVFQPGHGTGSALATGRWVREIKEIDVREWGATGAGGNTDDRPAIQAALDYAGSLVQTNSAGGVIYTSGPTVLFPTGTYALSAELTVPVGIRLEGRPGAYLQPTTSAGNTINLLRMGVADTYIDKLGFKGGFNCIALMGTNYDPIGGIQRAGGITECTFSGAVGHSIWHDHSPITRPANIRSFQYEFVISKVKHLGPHFIWAVNDELIIENSLLMYDASNRPTTTVQAGCAFDATTNVITKTTHGFTNGMKVTPGSDGGFSGSGLVSGTVYYVINATVNTFQVSLTPGGSAVDILTTSSGHFDLIKFQISSDGASLPLIAWMGGLTVRDVTVEFGGAGSGMPLPPADRAVFCGQGGLRIEGMTSFDGGGCLVRFRGTGNAYQGIGEATQTLDSGFPMFASTLTASSDRIGFMAHGLANGDPVTAEVTGHGLTAGKIYYVINKTTNDYQVATTRGGSTVDITSDGTATMRFALPFPSGIDIRGSYMNSIGTNFIEVYYEMPNFVWITDLEALNSDNCLGCYVNSDTVTFALESDGDTVNHRTFFQRHRGDPAPGNAGQLYNFGEIKAFRTWRLAAEADKYKFRGSTGVTDITEWLVTYKVRNDDLVNVAEHARDNLWPWTETDLIGGGHVTLGGNDYSVSGTEVETGYTSSKGLTSADSANFSFETNDFGAGTLAAGVYTFSLDWKCTEPGIFIFGYSLNGRVCNLKAVETEAGTRKRIWAAIYVPATSGGDTVAFRGTYVGVHTGKSFSAELPMLNKGYGPAPYARPSALSGMARIPSLTYGTGSPETVVPAPVGALYIDIAGGAGTTLYVKETGTGNTGWIGK